MRIIKKWIKNVENGKLIDKHLEKLITEDAVRCNLYIENFNLAHFLKGYYEAKKRFFISTLLGIMPNRAQYRHINKEGEEASHPEKYLLAFRFNDIQVHYKVNNKLFQSLEEAKNFCVENDLDIKSIEEDSSRAGTDMNTYDGRVRTSDDMMMVWWGNEKDLEYIVDAINKVYDTEYDRSLAYNKIVMKVLGDSCVSTLRRGSKKQTKKES